MDPALPNIFTDEGNVLIAQLHAHFVNRPNYQCVLLCDPAIRSPHEDAKFSAAAAGRDVLPVRVPSPRFPIAHRPFLLALDLSRFSDSELLGCSVRMAIDDRHPDVIARGHGQRICGWLSTCSPVEELRLHLSRQIFQPSPQGPSALRFYDPLVFDLLWPILTSEQRSVLLGPVEDWLLMTRTGVLSIYPRNVLSTPEEFVEPALRLTQDQWLAVNQIAAINRSLASWQHDGHPLTDDRPLAIAREAADRASSLGINDLQDKVAFIHLALDLHPYFDRHPAVQDALRKMQSQDLFFSDAISGLTESTKDEIRRVHFVSIDHRTII